MPIAVLAAANVSYFVAMILTLYACGVQLEQVHPDRHWSLATLARSLMWVNGLLLLCAGFAWGWRQLLFGLVPLACAWVAAAKALLSGRIVEIQRKMPA